MVFQAPDAAGTILAARCNPMLIGVFWLFVGRSGIKSTPQSRKIVPIRRKTDVENPVFRVPCHVYWWCKSGWRSRWGVWGDVGGGHIGVGKERTFGGFEGIGLRHIKVNVG